MVEDGYCDWMPVSSGISPGSMLEPSLSVIYINNLDVNVDDKLSKVSDEVNTGGVVDIEEDSLRLQNDID